MSTFAERLLQWWDTHGRKDLPWQTDKTPYRVWLSEIMLQQTQVATAIPYYQRFVAHLPNVAALAHAELDTVLHLWTGLGYYARARNLHRAARIIMQERGGELPRQVDALIALPGIGRSTAHAIATIALGQRAAILDGNVKRVLTRWRGIDGWPGAPAIESCLWQLADELTPRLRADDYTQAIMDLGATLCTRSKPKCAHCPVNAECGARLQGRTGEIPARRVRKVLPLRTTRMLIIENAEGAYLLEHRPPTGLWGGLWSFPEVPTEHALEEHLTQLGARGEHVAQQVELPVLTHGFTHFRLAITPTLLRLRSPPQQLMEPQRYLWYKPGAQRIGLTRPVTRLLESVQLIE